MDVNCHSASCRERGRYCCPSCEFRYDGGEPPECVVCHTKMTPAAGAPVLDWTCHHCLRCEECDEPFDECFDRRISYKVCSGALVTW